MGLFFRKEKKGRTIFHLDYGGVRLIQLQSDHQGADILAFKQKGWSGEGKETPFTDPERIKETFRYLLSSNGLKGRKVDLLLPDCMAKTAIIDLDFLPKGKNELLKLAYFKGQKSPPYPFEDTRIGIQVLSGKGKGGEGKSRIFSVFTSRALIEGIEKVLCDLGMEPGRIGLATLSLYNLFEKELNREEDTVFVAVFKDFFSLFLFSHGSPVFFRSKSLDAGESRLFLELQTSFLYYQNQNVAYQPQRALLWGIGDMGNIAAWLEELLVVKPSVLGTCMPLRIRQGLSIAPEELMGLAPVLGMIIK